MGPSEAELIRDAKGGDKEAFCRLASHYERRLLTLALHYCRDAHDAEDLSQEVWLKAYRAINSFRGHSSFYTWLRRIAINTFLNHQRGAKAPDYSAGGKSEKISLNDICEVVDVDAPSAEDLLYQKQLVEQVKRALDELTPQQRLIFLLKHREEMSCEEISQACDISIGTVKKALFRAVNKIRERLGIRLATNEQTSLSASKAS